MRQKLRGNWVTRARSNLVTFLASLVSLLASLTHLIPLLTSPRVPRPGGEGDERREDVMGREKRSEGQGK